MEQTLKETNKPTLFVWGDFREKNCKDRNKLKNEQLELFDELIDEVYLIIQTKTVRQNSINVFSKCISQNTQQLWAESGKWIMLFSHYFQEFETLISELLNHKSSTTRLHIIQSIWDNLPPDKVVVETLKRGLKDSNKKVRHFSINRIETLNLTDLLSDLVELQKSETEKDNLEFCSNTISLLQKGYYTDDWSETELSVIYKDKGALITFTIDKTIAIDSTIKTEIQERMSSS
jgi:hypothetical protein